MSHFRAQNFIIGPDILNLAIVGHIYFGPKIDGPPLRTSDRRYKLIAKRRGVRAFVDRGGPMVIRFSLSVIAFSCVFMAVGASASSAQQGASDQLKNTSQSSRAATRAGTTGAASLTASQNFDGGAPASNSVSAGNSGPGAYSDQSNSTQWQTDPSQNGSQSSSQSGGCPSGQAVDANGTCTSLSTPPSKNAAPWQKLINIATMLLLVISALSLARMLCDPTTRIYISHAIMALGAMLTLLGIAIMAAGQTLQGGILTAIGAFTAVLAYKQIVSTTAEIAKEAAAPQIGLAASQFAKQATPTPK